MSRLLIRTSFAGTFDFKLDDGACVANCGVGSDWLTVYLIETPKEKRGKGEAQKLLKSLTAYCKSTNKKMRLFCPMNAIILHICNKLGIENV